MRKYAVREAASNLKACFTNKRNGNIKSFTVPYKTKKNEQLKGWSWTLEKNNVLRQGESCKKPKDGKVSEQDLKLFIFKEMLGEMKYYSSKQFKKLCPGYHPENDCKIQKDRYGDYYLVFNRSIPIKETKQYASKPVACDPGIRKFLTTYSKEDGSKMYGVRWIEKLMPLALLCDTLKSKLLATKGKARNKIKEKIKRIRRQIHNYKKELHFKVANDLVTNYDMVLMPKLESGKLTMKKTRKLKTKVARSLLEIGHCRFFDILKEKCLEKGVVFLEVKEHYTSQTCPCCGKLNKCNETFMCQGCGFTHDRDIVGALNIFLKSVRTARPF